MAEQLTEEEAFKFYTSTAWKKKRAEVLKLDHYECQRCKAKGKYSRAEIVHHVLHLREHPAKALDIYDGDRRQLVSVCKRCHEELHPEAQRQNIFLSAPPLTAERWD